MNHSVIPLHERSFFCDDIITSGAHFKAAQTIIQKELPGAPVIGLFIARNVRPEIDTDF